MTPSRRPNVLVILTDQQRWDCSGLHGNPLGLMPNFDRLARAGTHVRYSFSCQPVCGPARSALQTGQYPTRLGTFRNDCPLPPGTPTLAHHFHAAGYRTAYFGKWHLAPRECRGAVPPEYRGGYQDWLGANILELVSDAYDCRLWDGEGREHALPGYRVDALTDAAIRYLAAAPPDPFFMFLSYLEPHHQNRRDDFPAPDGYEELFRDRWMPPDLAALGGTTTNHLGGYYGMVKRLDEALGRIYDALKSRGLLERTILLFTSDHGCHFKTRNAEYKRSGHDSSIRVPTMFHGPGFMRGGDRNELVSLIDLPPTLLDAAGVPVPREMQGRSLMPRLRRDPNAAWPDDVFVQISESQSGRAIRTRRWKYSVSVQGADAKLAASHPAWETYTDDLLYDLEADPHELTNLAVSPAHRDVVREMRDRLRIRLRDAGESVPTLLPELAGAADER